jgi:DNA gyrase/topoisomerase IV subunit A
MTVENQSSASEISSEQFLDRRDPSIRRSTPGLERRQFSDGHDQLSPEAAELGRAIDQYKLEKCRKYISYEEMLRVIKSLGYERRN